MQQIGYSKMAVNLVDMVADYCDSVIDQVHHISLRKLIFPKCRDTLKNQFFMFYLNFIIPATLEMNKIFIISDICSKKINCNQTGATWWFIKDLCMGHLK